MVPLVALNAVVRKEKLRRFAVTLLCDLTKFRCSSGSSGRSHGKSNPSRRSRLDAPWMAGAAPWLSSVQTEKDCMATTSPKAKHLQRDPRIDLQFQVAPPDFVHLMVRGETTALSYLHQYEKSRHTFRGKWLFTGDRYLMDEDGFYWHQGRGDDMLKVGGLWVSPSEVETALSEHAAVTECAVVGHFDDSGLLKPKAFVCLREDVEASDELLGELLKLCAGRLEAHKRPRWLTFVDELPRTATGFKLREQ